MKLFSNDVTQVLSLEDEDDGTSFRVTLMRIQRWLTREADLASVPFHGISWHHHPFPKHRALERRARNQSVAMKIAELNRPSFVHFFCFSLLLRTMNLILKLLWS